MFDTLNWFWMLCLAAMVGYGVIFGLATLRLEAELDQLHQDETRT